MSSKKSFWENVVGVGGSECWGWSAQINNYGYAIYKPSGCRMGVGAHRVAYEFCFGPIPVGKVIDHICHNKGCVNPLHLRLCTNSENVRNQKLHRDSTSGLKGVCWSKKDRKWRAQIAKDGRRFYLGDFRSKEEAHAAYCEAAKRLHGEFAYLGEAS